MAGSSADTSVWSRNRSACPHASAGSFPWSTDCWCSTYRLTARPRLPGILVGDIIVGAAGGRLSAPEDLLAVLGPERVGQALPLEILRGAAPQKLDVTVGEHLAHR